jgi:hypothetical protein
VVSDLGIVHILFLYGQFQIRHRGCTALISLSHVFKMTGTAVRVEIFFGVWHISVFPQASIPDIDGPEKSEKTDDHRGEGRE